MLSVGKYVYAFNATEGVRISLTEGVLESEDFQLSGKGEINFGFSNGDNREEFPLSLLWANRSKAEKGLYQCEAGTGYSGGHNTAERLGWSTGHKAPEPEAILWWKTATVGSFTGYFPYTVSIK